MREKQRELFEKILQLRKAQERIALKIAILHQDIREEDLREMGIKL